MTGFDPAKFAERLKTARRRAGLSRRQVAKLLNFSVQTVCHWERTTRIARIDTVCDLCRLYGVSADWILGLNNTEILEVIDDDCGSELQDPDSD